MIARTPGIWASGNEGTEDPTCGRISQGASFGFRAVGHFEEGEQNLPHQLSGFEQLSKWVTAMGH